MLIACRICNAQTPDWLWARSSTSSNINGFGSGSRMATDAFGNVFVAGHFLASSISFGPFTLYGSSQSSGNAFVAKYDSLGNILWAKNAVGTGHSYVLDVVTDISGNVYITGIYGNSDVYFDSDTLSYTPGGNLFLVKYDSSGNVQWARNAGGNSPIVVSRGVATDYSGNVYITGLFAGTSIAFESYVFTNSGNGEIFIAKYDSSGNVKWAIIEGGSSGDDSFSIASDLSGNVYITGIFNSQFIVFGSDTLIGSPGYSSMFLVKYDSSGNAIWANNSIGAMTEIGNDLTVSAYNEVYVIGYFNSPSVTFDSVVLLNNGINTNYFVKYDSSGNALWAKSYSKGLTNFIVADSIGNIYMSGVIDSSITLDSIVLQIPINSYEPMFIVKCDSSGTAMWAKALNNGAHDESRLGIGKNGSVYLCGGYHITPLIIGGDTLLNSCNNDIFVARLGYDPGVGIPEISYPDEFRLYPNPFDERLNIRSHTGDQLEVVIYDVISRAIIAQTFSNSVTLNTTQLEKGIYLYEVRNKSGVIKKGKIVKASNHLQ